MSAPVHTPTIVEFGTSLYDYEFSGSSWIQLRPTGAGLSFGGIGNAAGLAPSGLEICIQNIGDYSVTLPHASGSATAGARFAMPSGAAIVLAPAADPSSSPLGECVYARYAEGYDAPWSAEL